MELLKNEKVLSEPFNSFFLTNFRVVDDLTDKKDRTFKSIMLEDVQSTSFQYKSSPQYVLVGILVGAIIGIWIGQENMLFGLTAAIITIVISYFAYIGSRKVYLIISSSIDKIELIASGLNIAQAKKLIHSIETARFERVNALFKYSN